MKIGVSVVVCTYNGANLLPDTIRHIAQQRVRPDIKWEVIIIDNASTDDTSRIAEEEWVNYNNSTGFSILYQPKVGLAYARELGIQNAQYEFVLFCDDDNWLNPNYINLAYDLMHQNPSIGVLGGNGELLFETSPPRWLLKNCQFANGPQAKESGRVKSNIVYGAGFVVRKAAFRAAVDMGFKSMLTDRMAGKLCAGGDYEICYAIAMAGYDIWYDEKLTFKHFIPDCRTRWDDHVRLFKEGVQSFEVLVPYRIRVKQRSTNTLSFHFYYFLIILSYLIKLLAVLLTKMKLGSASKDTPVFKLRIISLKYKLFSLMAYSSIKRNFEKISKYEKVRLINELKHWKAPEIRKQNYANNINPAFVLPKESSLSNKEYKSWANK